MSLMDHFQYGDDNHDLEGRIIVRMMETTETHILKRKSRGGVGLLRLHTKYTQKFGREFGELQSFWWNEVYQYVEDAIEEKLPQHGRWSW